MARGEPNTWRTEEFAEIAREQCRRENAAARLCNRVLVCDTDAFATRVWHHRYMGAWSLVVDAISAEHRQPDLYLLTDVRTPFVQDGTRDGERIREWMHQTFVEQLAAYRRPFLELKGSRSQRVANAAAAVERVCRNGDS
jgi:HTH-type transcriptional regulator, transcriptional repressor of NAD biosynthesis genes